MEKNKLRERKSEKWMLGNFTIRSGLASPRAVLKQ